MSSFRRAVDKMVLVVNEHFEYRYDHEDEDFLAALADGYDKIFHPGRMYGVTLSVDGMFIYTEKPPQYALGANQFDNSYYSLHHSSYGYLAIIGKYRCALFHFVLLYFK